MNEFDIQHLHSAISVAWQAHNHGNHPFGAVLVDADNNVILTAENTVITGHDCTGHAETNLVRLATQRFSPEQLARCTLSDRSRAPCAPAQFIGAGSVASSLPSARSIFMPSIGPSPEHLLLPCREVFAHSQRRVTVHGPASALDGEAHAVHEGFWPIPSDPSPSIDLKCDRKDTWANTVQTGLQPSKKVGLAFDLSIRPFFDGLLRLG